ncbi:MAG: hypothetical protein AAGN66_15665 [Acidobacteriota bacterium]
MLLLHLLRFELILQAATLRARFATGVYLALTCAVPSWTFIFLRPHAPVSLGAASYWVPTLQLQQFATVLLAVALAGNRSGTSAFKELWPVMSASAMSNSGWLLRRWVALVLLLLPVTVVPPVVAMVLATAAGHPPQDPWLLVCTWCLRLAIPAASMAALWLGLVTIAGTELGAALVLMVARGSLDQVSSGLYNHLGTTVRFYTEWLGFASFQRWVYGLTQALRSPSAFWHQYGTAVSDGPLDPRQAWEQWYPGALALLGITVLVLGVATAFVHRTRRDLGPSLVGERHPLRTFAKTWHRLRETYTPDAAPRWELVAAGVGFTTLALCLGLVLARQQHYLGLASERFQEETGQNHFEPVPPGVQAKDWAITGEVLPGGRLDLQVVATISNGEADPAPHLAFTVNPFLQLRGIEAIARDISIQRSWDRLKVELDPPLGPGESLEFRMALTGRPQHPDFHVHGWYNSESFALKFKGFLGRNYPNLASDLALTKPRPAISRRRVDLGPGDLGPVLRYTTWELTPPPVEDLEPGWDVLPESFHPALDLRIDLRVPKGLQIADSCGHTLSNDDPRRLQGSCRTALSTFRIRGGRLVPAPSSDRVTMLTLPGHTHLARHQTQTIGDVARLSVHAWPGVEDVGALAVLEWPPAARFDDLRHGMHHWSWATLEVHGQMVSIPERLFVGREPISASQLVGRLLIQRVLATRTLEASQGHVFRAFIGELMVRRMGLGDPHPATVAARPWEIESLSVPVLEAPRGMQLMWGTKLPALVADLEGRVGRDRLVEAVERFLSNSELGSDARSLIGVIEAQSGVPLTRFYEDYFERGSLPTLYLEDVGVERVGDRWRVRGRLHNEGTGQSVCQIVLKSELREHPRTLTADDGESVGFEFDIEDRPLSLQLDPRRICHRLVTPASEKKERIPLVG